MSRVLGRSYFPDLRFFGQMLSSRFFCKKSPQKRCLLETMGKQSLPDTRNLRNFPIMKRSGLWVGSLPSRQTGMWQGSQKTHELVTTATGTSLEKSQQLCLLISSECTSRHSPSLDLFWIPFMSLWSSFPSATPPPKKKNSSYSPLTTLLEYLHGFH